MTRQEAIEAIINAELYSADDIVAALKGAGMTFDPEPAKKKLDWSKMPVDTLVRDNRGMYHYFREVENTTLCCFNGGRDSNTGGDYCSLYINDIHLTEGQWQANIGVVCPFPKGVEVIVVEWKGDIHTEDATHLDWADVAQYKVLGYSEGWE